MSHFKVANSTLVTFPKQTLLGRKRWETSPENSRHPLSEKAPGPALQSDNPHGSELLIEIVLELLNLHYIKSWIKTSHQISRIGVPKRDSSSRQILKACNLGRVEARYLQTKIVFRWSTNTSPVWNRSNTIGHTQILIRVMTIFSQNASILIVKAEF